MSLKSMLIVSAVAVAAATGEACTSWVIHPSVSASGRMLLHKCRDNKVGPLNARIVHTRHGVKWMQIGSGNGPLFVVSERGVASVMNEGDTMSVHHPNTDPSLKNARLSVNCSVITRQVMDECDSAEDAAKRMVHYGRNNLKSAHGNTILVADPKRAFLVDFGPGFAEAKEVTGGFAIITNCMHLPGVETVSTRDTLTLCRDRAREANVRASLQERRVNGKYTVKGTLETSRLRCEVPLVRKFPCRRGSLSAVCFEIDPEFPAQLTTAYVALGPPQHTIYLPTPMSIEKFPEEMTDGRWGELAYKLRSREGFDHKYLKEFTDYEARILPEHDLVREEARKLLREGKKDEAVKLLNDCYRRHYEGAWKLLLEIDARSAADPTPEDKRIKASF